MQVKMVSIPLLAFFIGILSGCTQVTQSRSILILPVQALGPSALAMRDLQIPADFDFENGQIIVIHDAEDSKGKKNTRSVYHIPKSGILEYMDKYKKKNNREMVHFPVLEKILLFNMD